MSPLFVLAWVFVAVYSVGDEGVNGYHVHHAWTLMECEDVRAQFLGAPYISRCEPITAWSP